MAFFKRHDRKKISLTIDDEPYEISGYSSREARRIASTLSEVSGRRTWCGGGEALERPASPPADVIAVEVDPSPEWNDATLRVPAGYGDELRRFLASGKVEIADDPLALSNGTLETVTVLVQNAAAWTALSAAVVAFLRRNSTKKTGVVIDGKIVPIEGYSCREAQQLATHMIDENQRRERLLRGDSDDGSEALPPSSTAG